MQRKLKWFLNCIYTHLNLAMSQENLHSGVCDKLACSVPEISLSLEIWDITSIDIILARLQIQKRWLG